MIPSIPTFDVDLILGCFLLLGGPNVLFYGFDLILGSFFTFGGLNGLVLWLG